jgi:hypothetical protein
MTVFCVFWIFFTKAVQQTRRTCHLNSASYLKNSVEPYFYFHLKIILTVYFMLVSPSLVGFEKYPYRLEVNHNDCPPSVLGTVPVKQQKLLFYSLILWQDWTELEQSREPVGGGEDDEGGVLRARHQGEQDGLRSYLLPHQDRL